MIDLDEKVFGVITSKEIIGAIPIESEIEHMLSKEMDDLIKNLKGKSKSELNKLKEKQTKVEKEINSRPGAMALPQNKIRLFTEFSKQYVQKIEDILKQT